MATEATFTVPSDQFPLGTVFDQLPNVTVTPERLIPADDAVIPYFWVRGTEVDDSESKFKAHPAVREIQLVDSVEDEHLLRLEWEGEHDDVLTILAETEIPLIEGTGTNQQWTFEIRGVELELWVIDRSGRLCDGEGITDAHERIKPEFIGPLVERQTEPHDTELGLRRDLQTDLFGTRNRRG